MVTAYTGMIIFVVVCVVIGAVAYLMLTNNDWRL